MSPTPFKENRNAALASRPAALYVHVPFCRAKCRYCDFFSVKFDAAQAARFVQAATAELAAHVDELTTTTTTTTKKPLASVFVGGGTPTVLGTELLGTLLAAIRPLICPTTEFSVEANCGVLEAATAEMLAASGVNRVNLGAQSFQAEELKLLGRVHGVEQIPQAVSLLKDAGIANVGIDLIYAIPGQRLTTWRDSLARALALPIEHLSCYALSFEPGTALYDDLHAGSVEEMPAADQRDCYYAAIEAAEQAGFEHYEISNFARPLKRCRHNMTYWLNEPYVGIGPGAASYVGGVRRTNQPDLQAYITAILNNQPPPSTAERLSGRAAMAETLMLALRLIDGVDRAAFTRRFNQDPLAAFGRSLGRYGSLGAVIASSSHLRIAAESLFVSDSILAAILAEA